MGRSGGCCLGANCTAPPCPSGSCCYINPEYDGHETLGELESKTKCEDGVTENCCLSKPFSFFNKDEVCGENILTCEGNSTPEIFNTDKAFCFLFAGSCRAWGDPLTGGDMSNITSSQNREVIKVYSNPVAFVAVEKDKTAFCWGDASKGGSFLPTFTAGEDPETLDNIKSVIGSAGAFTAIKTDGTVIAWGDADFGGAIPPSIKNLLIDIVEVVSTDRYFAARNTNGEIFIWGNGAKAYDKNDVNKSGSVTALDANIINSQLPRGVYRSSCDVTGDGSVTALDALQVVNYLATPKPYDSGFTNVKKIYSNKHAFAFLKNDNSLFVWGDENKGGNTGAIQSYLENIEEVHSTEDSFLIKRSDGKIFGWGNTQISKEFNLNHDEDIYPKKYVREIYPSKHSYGIVYTQTKLGDAVDGNARFDAIGSIKPSRQNIAEVQELIDRVIGRYNAPQSISLPIELGVYSWDSNDEFGVGNGTILASDNAFYIYDKSGLNPNKFYTVGFSTTEQELEDGELAWGQSFKKEHDALYRNPFNKVGSVVLTDSSVYEQYKYVGQAARFNEQNSKFTRSQNSFAYTDRASAFIIGIFQHDNWSRRRQEVVGDLGPHILSVGDVRYGGYGTSLRRDLQNDSNNWQRERSSFYPFNFIEFPSPLGDQGHFYGLFSNRHAFCAIYALPETITSASLEKPSKTRFKIICWGDPDFGGTLSFSSLTTQYSIFNLINDQGSALIYEGCHQNYCDQDFT